VGGGALLAVGGVHAPAPVPAPAGSPA
jgi:hypothetical protein